MEAINYEFEMPIGDWSGDGHGKCDTYHILSNQPVEQVRETHYKTKEVTGIDIEEVCADYEDSILSPEAANTLREMGFEPGKYSYCCTGSEEDGVEMSPRDMAELWCFLLMKTDPELKLEIIPEAKLPMLPFYGFDDKKRHISFVGYGCYVD